MQTKPLLNGPLWRETEGTRVTGAAGCGFIVFKTKPKTNAKTTCIDKVTFQSARV